MEAAMAAPTILHSARYSTSSWQIEGTKIRLFGSRSSRNFSLKTGIGHDKRKGNIFERWKFGEFGSRLCVAAENSQHEVRRNILFPPVPPPDKRIPIRRNGDRNFVLDCRGTASVIVRTVLYLAKDINEGWVNYSQWPESAQELLLQEFLRRFKWADGEDPEQCEATFKCFTKDRMRSFLYMARNEADKTCGDDPSQWATEENIGRTCPWWCTEDNWRIMCEIFSTDKYQKRRASFKRNRYTGIEYAHKKRMEEDPENKQSEVVRPRNSRKGKGVYNTADIIALSYKRDMADLCGEDWQEIHSDSDEEHENSRLIKTHKIQPLAPSPSQSPVEMDTVLAQIQHVQNLLQQQQELLQKQQERQQQLEESQRTTESMFAKMQMEMEFRCEHMYRLLSSLQPRPWSGIGYEYESKTPVPGFGPQLMSQPSVPRFQSQQAPEFGRVSRNEPSQSPSPLDPRFQSKWAPEIGKVPRNDPNQSPSPSGQIASSHESTNNFANGSMNTTTGNEDDAIIGDKSI